MILLKKPIFTQTCVVVIVVFCKFVGMNVSERGRLAKTGDRFGQIVGREKRKIMGRWKFYLERRLGLG